MKILEVIPTYQRRCPNFFIKINDNIQIVNSARINNKKGIDKAQKTFDDREKQLSRLGFKLLGKEFIEQDGSLMYVWGILKGKYTKEIESQLDW